MALVADYFSSGEEEEDEVPTSAVAIKPVTNGVTVSTTKPEEDSLISDEEDEDFFSASDRPRRADDLNLPGLSSSSTSSFFANLPSTSKSNPDEDPKGDFVDPSEDTATIPKASDTEKAAAARMIKPGLLGKKGKRKGPVKIVLPSLSNFDDKDDDEDGPGAKKPRFGGSKSGSALLSMLPSPRNAVPSKEANRILVPNSVARKKPPNPPPKPSPIANKKPSLVSVAAESESEDDEEGATPFFTLEAEKITPVFDAPSTSKTMPISVKANPGASSSIPSRASLVPQPEEEEAVVGPSRPTEARYAPYPEAEDLMANTDALERLAGKNAMKNSDGIDVIDVKETDLTADPREWMTKALTEEDKDKPGPRCTIKGNQRRKHQITYLAALAKENEHKLQEQWARNFATKKAAGAKYGFF